MERQLTIDSLKEKTKVVFMNLTTFQIWLEENGRKRTESVGGEIVLGKETALKAIDLLEDAKLIVLGGDVYRLNDNFYDPTYDNWYCEQDNDESSQHFSKRSIEIARRYISQYSDPLDGTIWYVLVTQ